MYNSEQIENIATAFANAAYEVLRRFADAFCEFYRMFVNAVVSQTCTSRRVLHLARHAKKHRVRKKNRNRICRAIRKSKNGWQK